MATSSIVYPDPVSHHQLQDYRHTAAVSKIIPPITICIQTHITSIFIKFKVASMLACQTVPYEEVYPTPRCGEHPVCRVVPGTFVCDNMVIDDDGGDRILVWR